MPGAIGTLRKLWMRQIFNPTSYPGPDREAGMPDHLLHSSLDGSRRAILMGAVALAMAGQAMAGDASYVPPELRSASPEDFWAGADAILAAGVGISASPGAVPDPECFGGHDEQASRAALFLISLYDGDRVGQGSGTIVSGSGGGAADRVLTSGHVIATEVTQGDGSFQTLVEVLAFDSSGRLLGSMQPVLSGDRGPDENGHNIVHILNDIAVLEMIEFADAAAEADWNGRGLQISPVQGSSAMIVTTDSWSDLLNPGLSGSAVLDSENRISGVANYVIHQDDAPQGATSGAWSERASRSIQGEIDWLSLMLADISSSLRAGTNGARRTGGLLIAPTIHQAELLEHLGVDPETVTREHREFEGTMAGYPGWECRSGPIKASPMTGWAMPGAFDPDLAEFYKYGPEWKVERHDPYVIELEPIIVLASDDVEDEEAQEALAQPSQDSPGSMPHFMAESGI